ncbi:hypothetical protein HELRODRAFT_176583 [Helobdella robusta]|uniref:Uncharacterized protein n=1 Tax=Helobdella robusta TaxID=6412 RepID=T1FAP2_HELRO|nr:hypothetical protein HELRODRAFT_176583 [Helobdella robusta]ESN99815.1 hypothetical protein HELRODRAFT_176583 [Helobdella robusta]
MDTSSPLITSDRDRIAVDLRSDCNSSPVFIPGDDLTTPASTSKTKKALEKLIDLKNECSHHRVISASKKDEIETIIKNGELLHRENRSKIKQNEANVVSIVKSYFEKLNQENDEKFSDFKAPYIETIKKIDGLITKMDNIFDKYCSLTDKLNRFSSDGKDDVADEVLSYNSFKPPKLPEVKNSQFDIEHIPHNSDLENFLKRNTSTFGRLSQMKKN